MRFLRFFLFAMMLCTYFNTTFGMQQITGADQAFQLNEIDHLLATNEPLGLGFLTLVHSSGNLNHLRDERGATMLHILAEMGWLNGVAFWLSRHPEQREALDHEGLTPLDYAQRTKQHTIVALLSTVA